MENFKEEKIEDFQDKDYSKSMPIKIENNNKTPDRTEKNSQVVSKKQSSENLEGTIRKTPTLRMK